MSALALALGGELVGCGSSNDDRPANWSYISAAIIQPNCATANCHSALSARSGVQLDTIAAGFKALVNPDPPKKKDQYTQPFVVPGDSANSALHALLRGQGTRRMPPDTVLPNDDLTLIDRWIDAGALNDLDKGAP
jgi:hypothetical protein